MITNNLMRMMLVMVMLMVMIERMMIIIIARMMMMIERYLLGKTVKKQVCKTFRVVGLLDNLL